MRALDTRSAWYQSEVRAHDRALVSPMGTEAARNERAAIAIARELHKARHGIEPHKRAPAVCRWITNRHGVRVIRAVTFGPGNEYELPGWQGRALPVEREEPSLF